MNGTSRSLALAFLVMAPTVQTRAAENAAAAAARQRQEAVKTLSIQFKRTEVIAPGGVTLEAGRFATAKNPIPAVETKLESVNRFAFAELGMVRLEDNHPSWMVTDGRLLERSCISVTDGVEGLIFYPNGVAGDGAPRGVIENTVRVPTFRSPELAPIALTFRALETMLSDEDIKGWNPTGEKASIGEATCEEYDSPGSSRAVRRFWVDPARGHVVRRIQINYGGKPGRQCDIDYCPHEVAGWVPSGWRWSFYSPSGALYKMTRVEVTEMAINEPQDLAQYILIFPPGTKVTNNKRNEDYWVKDDQTPQVRGTVTQEPIVAALVPEIPWYQKHPWLLSSLAVAAVLGLGISLWRGLRTKQVGMGT